MNRKARNGSIYRVSLLTSDNIAENQLLPGRGQRGARAHANLFKYTRRAQSLMNTYLVYLSRTRSKLQLAQRVCTSSVLVGRSLIIQTVRVRGETVLNVRGIRNLRCAVLERTLEETRLSFIERSSE